MTDTELHNLCESCAREIEKRIIELDKNEITNGDVIKAVFPSAEVTEIIEGTVNISLDTWTPFSEDWWNSPYKEKQDD